MTAIEAVATYLPDHAVPIADLAAQFELSPMQVRLFTKFLGLSQVRIDPDGSLSDLLLAAATRLEALRGREQQVRYVLHARSMPVAVPYPLNPLHDLCAALGLRHAIAFTVTHHACATALVAIDAAGRLLAADGAPDSLALILAGEKAFTLDAQLVPGTSVFGEASAACLVRAHGNSDRVLAFATSTRGEFDGRLEELPDLAGEYEEEYPRSLASVMHEAVARAGLTMDQITLILPHNVNAVSWQRLCRKIDFPVERVVLGNVPQTGHAFCADLFINYMTAADLGMLRPGDHYLAVAAGQGATFSAMVFAH
jgi:3-oxoacyl-[acyl-carrier-protein] synthase-3